MGPMSVGMGAPGMGLGMMQASPMGMPYSGLSPMGPPGSALLGHGGVGPPQLILGGPTGTGGLIGGRRISGRRRDDGSKHQPFSSLRKCHHSFARLFQPPLSYLLPPSFTSLQHNLCPKRKMSTSLYFKKRKKKNKKSNFSFFSFKSIISFQHNFPH